jgi:hypothetical protein
MSAAKDQERQAFADRPHWHRHAKGPQRPSWMRWVPRMP